MMNKMKNNCRLSIVQLAVTRHLNAPMLCSFVPCIVREHTLLLLDDYKLTIMRIVQFEALFFHTRLTTTYNEYGLRE